MDYSGPGSFVLGIFQARIREWVAISFSRGSSWPKDETCVSCIGRQIITQASGETNFFHHCCSVRQSCPTLCDHMNYSTPDLPAPHRLLKFAQVHVHCLVIPSSHLILWHPLFLRPSTFPSIRDFSSKSAVSIKWPKYWRFRFSISPSSEYSGLISLKIDWFDLSAERLSGVFSCTTVQRHKFFGVLPFSQFSSHKHMWLLGHQESPCFSIQTPNCSRIIYVKVYPFLTELSLYLYWKPIEFLCLHLFLNYFIPFNCFSVCINITQSLLL